MNPASSSVGRIESLWNAAACSPQRWGVIEVTTRLAGQLPEDRIGKEALPEVSGRPKQPTGHAVVIGWSWVRIELQVADTDNGEAAINLV